VLAAGVRDSQSLVGELVTDASGVRHRSHAHPERDAALERFSEPDALLRTCALNRSLETFALGSELGEVTEQPQLAGTANRLRSRP
jgi:hypothetical protein